MITYADLYAENEFTATDADVIEEMIYIDIGYSATEEGILLESASE